MAKKPGKASDVKRGREAEGPAAGPPAPVAAAIPRFGDILGQERALSVLRGAMRSGRIHHAWIFHGPVGVGKFTTAVAFASMVLDPTTGSTLSGEIEPDPSSPTQQLLRSGSHPDLHIVTKELARFSEDAQVRDRKLTTIPKDVIDTHLVRPAAMKASAQQSGMASKVFIVDEAELLDRSPTNAPVQNAILKTMEEPASGTVIILVTSNESRLLMTIRSRCQRVAFCPLDAKSMREWCRAAGIAPEPWLLEFASGSPGIVKLAVETGIAEWDAALRPRLDAAGAGRPPHDLGLVMAKLVDEWATRRVEGRENASKEAANRAAGEHMFAYLAAYQRVKLRAAAGGTGAEHRLRAIDAIDEAERALDSNVQGVFVFEGLAARLASA